MPNLIKTTLVIAYILVWLETGAISIPFQGYVQPSSGSWSLVVRLSCWYTFS